MHWSGKVFMWLVVLGTIASTVLTSKMLQVRNSWTKKFEDLNGNGTPEKIGAYEQNAIDIEKKTQKRNQLRDELVRVERGWGRYWNNVTAEPSPLKPEALAFREIGTNQGFVVGHVVYVFQPNPGGGYSFVGPYEVGDATEESLLVVVPAWRPRVNAPTEMHYGANWRIRQMILHANKARFSDLTVELALKDELLLAKQQNVVTQNQMVSIAQEHLQLRQRELNGDPNNKELEGKIPQHLIDGLVQAIQDTEEDRNAVLADVDDLRRRLHRTYQNYLAIRDDNKELANTQSAPASLVTAGASQ